MNEILLFLKNLEKDFDNQVCISFNANGEGVIFVGIRAAAIFDSFDDLNDIVNDYLLTGALPE